jgi:ATP-dependent Lon protease
MAWIIGQAPAADALRFGLETRAKGQNVFVRGLEGTGRSGLVRQVLEAVKVAGSPTRDRCYVHDFIAPDRPALVTLPAGRGHAFRRAIDRLARYIRDDLARALRSDVVRAQRTALEQESQRQIEEIVSPFEASLRSAHLRLVSVPMGPMTRGEIVPVVNGQPLPPEALDEAVAEGRITTAQQGEIQRVRAEKVGELQRIGERVQDVRRAHDEELHALLESQVRSLLEPRAAEVVSDFDTPAVRRFLGQVIEDVLERRRGNGSSGEREDPGEDFTCLYAVNVLLSREEAMPHSPVIVETAPTVHALLGTISPAPGREGRVEVPHLAISAGSLLRADGGFLVLEAREVLSEPGAWKILARTLKTGRLELTPPAPYPLWPIVPEAIDVDIKVILMGDYESFSHLDGSDPEFPHLFKVLVDFDETIPRDAEGLALYAGVLARLVKQEGLPPFHRDSVAALTEHGARIAARQGKLTARFGRLADIAREAVWIARKASENMVRGTHVREAVRAGTRRASLHSRRFHELIMERTLHVQAAGKEIGQINGLAVLRAGPLTYGFPARITATIGAGSAGIINIEREAALSGAIHTKAFLLLSGVLRTLLQTDHPLTFNASIAFEQSYGSIDGDSASGAEVCCLLSALTAIPLRQDVAMTGAIDQMGNEKIEGFFDSCRDLAGAGPLGVIIPAANAGDLMLRENLLEAASQGRLRIWPVRTVQEALEILTGMPAGVRDPKGYYPEGSLLALAMKQAREYWVRASQAPDRPGRTRISGRGHQPGTRARRREARPLGKPDRRQP